MFFKLNKKKIIEVTMRNGLYIVTYVTSGYHEKAFLGTSVIKEATMPANEDIEIGSETEGYQKSKLTPK